MDPGVPSPNANTEQEAQCKLQEWSSQALADLNTSWVAEREVWGREERKNQSTGWDGGRGAERGELTRGLAGASQQGSSIRFTDISGSHPEFSLTALSTAS